MLSCACNPVLPLIRVFRASAAALEMLGEFVAALVSAHSLYTEQCECTVTVPHFVGIAGPISSVCGRGLVAILTLLPSPLHTHTFHTYTHTHTLALCGGVLPSGMAQISRIFLGPESDQIGGEIEPEEVINKACVILNEVSKSGPRRARSILFFIRGVDCY